jgi:hypothetical protein
MRQRLCWGETNVSELQLVIVESIMNRISYKTRNFEYGMPNTDSHWNPVLRNAIHRRKNNSPIRGLQNVSERKSKERLQEDLRSSLKMDPITVRWPRRNIYVINGEVDLQDDWTTFNSHFLSATIYTNEASIIKWDIICECAYCYDQFHTVNRRS